MKNKKSIGILVGMLVIFTTLTSVAGTMISNKTIRETLADHSNSEHQIIDLDSNRNIEYWLEKAKLTASDGATDDYFGYSVSISDDVAIVGADGDDGLRWRSGSAYIIIKDIPSIIYVKADASGENNGSSWIDAFTDLQDALAIAQAHDQIWVATGTYTPDSGSCDCNASFILVDTVEIYGGFIGIEQSLEERAGLFEQTILSGDLLHNDQPEFTNYEDNAYHVVTSINNNESTMIDGFTIRGGYASIGYPHSYGGGMNNFNSSPIIKNCIFTENWGTGGGGMYNKEGSNPIIISCIFMDNNVSTYGGAIFNNYGYPTLTNVKIINNHADHYGGGLYCHSSGGDIKLNRCFFKNNSAQYGGGIYSTSSDNFDITIDTCIFIGNTASGGSVISNWQSFPGDLYISNSTFVDNTASSGYAFYIRGDYISNCILWNGGNEINPQIIYLRYCDIQGGWPYPSVGIIDADPQFINPEHGDYHLKFSSPCIDMGNPSYNYDLNSTDFDGDPRVWDGDGDGIRRIDMGADEYFCPYDVNIDGVVDTLDYGLVMAAFGCDPSDPAYAPYDVNDDGVINTIDCGLVEAAYGPCL